MARRFVLFRARRPFPAQESLVIARLHRADEHIVIEAHERLEPVEQQIFARCALWYYAAAVVAHQNPEYIGRERPRIGRLNQDSAKLIPGNSLNQSTRVLARYAAF